MTSVGNGSCNCVDSCLAVISSIVCDLPHFLLCYIQEWTLYPSSSTCILDIYIYMEPTWCMVSLHRFLLTLALSSWAIMMYGILVPIPSYCCSFIQIYGTLNLYKFPTPRTATILLSDMGAKGFAILGGKTVGLLIRLTGQLWNTWKVVVLDSGFLRRQGSDKIGRKGCFCLSSSRSTGTS